MNKAHGAINCAYNAALRLRLGLRARLRRRPALARPLSCSILVSQVIYTLRRSAGLPSGVANTNFVPHSSSSALLPAPFVSFLLNPSTILSAESPENFDLLHQRRRGSRARLLLTWTFAEPRSTFRPPWSLGPRPQHGASHGPKIRRTRNWRGWSDV